MSHITVSVPQIPLKLEEVKHAITITEEELSAVV